jgi:hypothetical protein
MFFFYNGLLIDRLIRISYEMVVFLKGFFTTNIFGNVLSKY